MRPPPPPPWLDVPALPPFTYDANKSTLRYSAHAAMSVFLKASQSDSHIIGGVIKHCNSIIGKNYFFWYQLLATKLDFFFFSQNCRFQSEKIEPLWHDKTKTVPFITVFLWLS